MLVTGFWEPKKKPPLGGGFGFDMAYRGHYYVSRTKNRSQIGIYLCVLFVSSIGALMGLSVVMGEETEQCQFLQALVVVEVWV